MFSLRANVSFLVIHILFFQSLTHSLSGTYWVVLDWLVSLSWSVVLIDSTYSQCCISNLIIEDLVLQPQPGTRFSTSHVIITWRHMPCALSASWGFCTPFPGKEDRGGWCPMATLSPVLRVRIVNMPLENACWLLFLTPSGQGQTFPTGPRLPATTLHALIFRINLALKLSFYSL